MRAERVVFLGGIAWLLAVSGAFAQRATGSVSGIVVDARSGQPLSQVRVSVERGTARTTTSPAGRFLIADLDAGRHRLEISLVGYGLAHRDVDVGAGATTDLTIPLSAGTDTYTEQVQVRGDLFPRDEVGVASQMTIGSADLQNLRSLLADDPMRAVQTLPGVGGSDDFRSDFSVRGSDFRHIGVTLDGVPSPLLVHTVHNAYDSGSLAMINSDILESVSLLAGSYPQRYGDRTGAQVDFRTREGSREQPQVRLAVSAINASMVVEGPVGGARRGSWLVSARKSYIDWLIRRIDPETSGTFGFIDTQGKFVYDLTPRQVLQVNVVAGRSRYDEHADNPSPNSLEIGVNRSILGGVSLRSTFSPRVVMTQRLYTVSNRFSNHNATTQIIDRGGQDDVSYRADASVSATRALAVEAGVHLQRVQVDGETRFYDGLGLRVAEQGFASTHGRTGGYVLARVRPIAALTLSPGVRFDRWGLTRSAEASPWVQAELVLPRALIVAAGTGVHRQSPEVVEVDGPEGLRDPRIERARHLDVGVGQQVGAYRWQVTAFERSEDDMLWRPGSEPRLVEGAITPANPFARFENALEGTARGLELSLQRRSVNGISGWVGYARVAARYTDAGRAEAFPANVEQRHALNVYGHYRLSSRVSVSGRFRAATNTPIVGYLREVEGRYFLDEVRNRVRLPFYSRLDLRGNRTFDVARGRLTLYVEIINAYNRRNRRGREDPSVNRRTGEVRDVSEKLFPIVPSVGFLLEF